MPEHVSQSGVTDIEIGLTLQCSFYLQEHGRWLQTGLARLSEDELSGARGNVRDSIGERGSSVLHVLVVVFVCALLEEVEQVQSHWKEWLMVSTTAVMVSGLGTS